MCICFDAIGSLGAVRDLRFPAQPGRLQLRVEAGTAASVEPSAGKVVMCVVPGTIVTTTLSYEFVNVFTLKCRQGGET